MNLENLTIENYKIALRRARWMLKKYNTGIMDAKTIEDFAMDALLADQFSCGAIKFDVIDAARRERKGSRNSDATIRFIPLFDCEVLSNDPATALEKSEEYKDVELSLPPNLTKDEKHLAIEISKGRLLKEIAKDFKITPSAMTLRFQKLIKKFMNHPEWSSKLERVKNLYERRN
jgi:hypothetical protein